MSQKILCVDDDANILQAYRRSLRKRFELDIALGAEEALEAVKSQGPYAVIVADMRMPGMNGVELLAEVRKIAPDTVRMMLTGNADQQTAIDAVNEGHIFRFLTKPCPPELFAKSLEAALEQHRLITAEKELLSKTLRGSVKVLTDVLGLVNPVAFGRAGRIQRLARELARELGVENGWQIELAAMLSQIGCVTISQETLSRFFRGEQLSRSEHQRWVNHPIHAYELLREIPRLETVAEIVKYQEKRYDGGGFPPDPVAGEEIPLGSRILKVALDFDLLASAGHSRELALAEMTDRHKWYDPHVLAALHRVLAVERVHVIRRVPVAGLIDGAILAEDVLSIRGTLLCAKGQEVTPTMRARLNNYCANVGVQTPIKLFVPIELLSEESHKSDGDEPVVTGAAPVY